MRASTRWQVVSAETLLDRANPDQIRLIWPLLQRWDAPADTDAAELAEIGRWINRSKRAERLSELAERIHADPQILDTDDDPIDGVDAAALDLATLIVPTHGEDESEEPVLTTKGVLRVAARFSGQIVDRRNRLTDGRLAIARMIGGDTDARAAHLGLVELANTLCTTPTPKCGPCPLRSRCQYASSQSDNL